MPGERVERDEPLELPPFDDFYAGQQRLRDEKEDERAMDLAMQREGDGGIGHPGFTSKGLNKDHDKPTTKPDKPAEPAETRKDSTPEKKASEPKWYVWHNCGDNVGWWCHLRLGKKTKDFLNDKNNRAVVGPSESEKQARQAVWGMMDKSTFYEKGQGGAGVDTGTIVKIGGKVYDVTPFVYWDSKAKVYKRR